jgi:hypothetical protein
VGEVVAVMSCNEGHKKDKGEEGRKEHNVWVFVV